MADIIDNCEVYAGKTYEVAISHGRRIMHKVALKARVDATTGEVTFYVPTSEIDTLRA